jgi:hypothetical protein
VLVPYADLARPRLTLRFALSGSAGGPYALSPAGALVVGLERVSARVRRGFGGGS